MDVIATAPTRFYSKFHDSKSTKPSRSIRCDVWIVERMCYRQTDRPTDTALSHLKRSSYITDDEDDDDDDDNDDDDVKIVQRMRYRQTDRPTDTALSHLKRSKVTSLTMKMTTMMMTTTMATCGSSNECVTDRQTDPRTQLCRT